MNDALASFIDENGNEFAMGNIMQPTGLLRSWPVFGAVDNAPLIPRLDWQEVSMHDYLPPVHQQNGVGQCNPEAVTCGIEACRALAGLPPVRLSPADLYLRVNGGRDRGSILEDAMAEAMRVGVGPLSSVPAIWKPGMQGAPDSERAKFRATEAWLAPTFEHLAAMVQLGFFVVIGIKWYDNYNVDGDGWLPQQGKGRWGGHALLCYGLERRNGVWGLPTRNSWGDKWGRSGNCVIPESAFTGPIGGWWGLRAVVNEAGDMPTPLETT